MIYLTASDAVDYIGKVSENINEYGAYPVLLAVFIVVFLIVIIYMNNSHKKMIESIVKSNENYCESIKKQNEDLLNEIMAGSNADRNYDEKDLASIFVKLNKTIKGECQKTQKTLNAESVCVYVLHNGMVASHGLPFFKMSCICEWIKKGSGVSSRLREHSNLPLNLFDRLISGLFENGEYVIELDDITGTSLDMFINGPKVVNCVCIPIYDNDNKIMGFITADFSFEVKQETIKFDRIKEELIDLTAAIKPVLDYSDYQNINNN